MNLKEMSFERRCCPKMATYIFYMHFALYVTDIYCCETYSYWNRIAVYEMINTVIYKLIIWGQIYEGGSKITALVPAYSVQSIRNRSKNKCQNLIELVLPLKYVEYCDILMFSPMVSTVSLRLLHNINIWIIRCLALVRLHPIPAFGFGFRVCAVLLFIIIVLV